MTAAQSTSVAELAATHGRSQAYAYLDERTKRNVRRALLKALAIPGWQVPFASREMPVARGWGSGGLQLTLSLVGPHDTVKVIDQGDDSSANASSMRELIASTSGCQTTTKTTQASIIQSRHRIPELPMTSDQLLVLQVPHPDPLRRVVPDEHQALHHHAQQDYTPAWLDLYDDEARLGGPRTGADYPVMVEGRTLMSPSPIPRYDVLRLNNRPHPILLGAGRKAKVTALPPFTRVEPLTFTDRSLLPEHAEQPCSRCGSETSYRVPASNRYELETAQVSTDEAWLCSDVDACQTRKENR